MGLIISDDDKKTHGDRVDKHPAAGKYEGLNPERHTTDFIFFIAIFAMWICMSCVGGYAVRNGGNAYRLLGPISSSGDICGYSDGYKSSPYLFTVTTTGLGICVDSCPSPATTPSSSSTSYSDYYCLPYISNSYSSVYTSSGATAAATAFASYITSSCMTNGAYDYTKTTSYSCLCNLQYQSTKYLNRCIFDDDTIQSHYTNMNTPNYFKSFIADVIVARNIIFGFGFCLALGLSFILSSLLRWKTVAYTIIWTSLSGFLAFQIAFIYFCYKTSYTWDREEPQTHNQTSIYALRAFSVILMAFCGLYVCVMIFLRNSINIAIQVMVLSSQCLAEMPFLAVTPLVNLVGFGAFFVAFIFYCFNIASQGELKAITETYNGLSVTVGYKFEPLDSDKQQEELWFMFFCLLWTMNFICAIGIFVVAYCSAKWYFTEPDKRGPEIGCGTVLSSYWICIRYHLGTLAFGSLIIAFVQFVRAVLLYITKHSKQISENCVLKYLMCCVQCCLCCLEKCLKFISKNAYIQTAIHNSGFCHGAYDGFFLVARNIFRIGALHVVSGIALVILKLFVTSAVGCGTYFIFMKYYNDKLNDFIAPTLLTMIIAYVTCAMFCDVYDLITDSILMCYISDEEANGKAKFASDDMHSFIDAHTAQPDDKIEKEPATEVEANTK